MNKLAIIDIDGLFYMSCRESLELSIESFKERLNNLFEKTECDYWCGFVTKGKCFRYSISDEYKANRKDKPKPKYLSSLREWAIDEYNLNVCDLWEADDAVKYWGNSDRLTYSNEFEVFFDYKNIFDGNTFVDKLIIPNKIICSPDKDVLQSIPGRNFNYSYKLTEKNNPDSLIKGWWVETEFGDSNYFRLKQYLTGDASDNVKTPFPESAGNWFVENRMNFNDLVSAYILGFNYETQTGMKKFIKGLGTNIGLCELAKNVRLLHILENDEDFMRECKQLPPFPKINKVEKYVSENKEIEF